jgi:PKD repeat protein
MIGWNINWQEGTPCQGTFCFLKGWTEPPPEFSGPIPTNQEVTQQALIALVTYYNLVLNPSGNGLNDGIQPFYNYVFQSTGNNVQTRSFSANDIFASGEYVLNLNIINEGDGYNRNLAISFDGGTTNYVLQVNSANTTSIPHSDSIYNVSVPLGVLESNSDYTIGIKLTTYNYTTPFDWWIVDASIQRVTPPGQAQNPFTASMTPSEESGSVPLSVSFTASASGGTTPYSYSWSFGDGGMSTSQNPSHTYENTGVFYPTVTITDAHGLKSTASGMIVVSNSTCVDPPTSESINYTSYNTGGGNAGGGTYVAGADITLHDVACETLSGHVVMNIFNSNGVPIVDSQLYTFGPDGSPYYDLLADPGWYESMIMQTNVPSTGDYTVQSFCLLYDGVPVSQVMSGTAVVSAGGYGE